MGVETFGQAAAGHSLVKRVRDLALDLTLASLGYRANAHLDGARINMFRDALERAKADNRELPHAPAAVMEAVDRVLMNEGRISSYSMVIIPREVQLGCLRTRIDDAMDAGDKRSAMMYLNALETIRKLPSCDPAPRNTPTPL